MIPLLTTVCILLAIAVAVLARSLRASRRDRQRDARSMTKKLDETVLGLQLERSRILNALDHALLLLDSEGLVEFANIPALKLFAGRKLTNRHIAEVLLDEPLASPVREALARGTQVTHQVTLSQQASPPGPEDRQGGTTWIIDAGPIDSNRLDEGFRVIIRDHTVQHQTEQVRKDFVANASHELRTPLTIINGYIENLLENDLLEDPARTKRFLGTMQKHGARIARIVEDMLVISRLESGEAAALNIEPFVLAECVHDVLDRLEPVIASQGAKITTTIPDPGLSILGDRFYWTQVLFNLVENALKQNPRHKVGVEIGVRRGAGGALTIWVSDDGVGIPSADLPFIFRRFYRVEKHHSQEGIKGTGLGLSIVKRAVEAHRGHIEVTSTPGLETRFQITLPREVLSSP